MKSHVLASRRLGSRHLLRTVEIIAVPLLLLVFDIQTVLSQARQLFDFESLGCLAMYKGKPKTSFLTESGSLSEGTRVFVYIALYLTPRMVHGLAQG